MPRKKTVSKKKIIESLHDQLRARGADIAIFEDMVNDYARLWDLKESMQKDIQENGLRFEALASTGKKVMKENPSIANILKVNSQMLAILKALDLTTSKVKVEDADDDL